MKELSKNLSRLNEDVTDIEKAIKFIATVPDNDDNDVDDTDDNVRPELPNYELKSAEFNLPSGSTEKLSNLLKNVLQAKVNF